MPRISRRDFTRRIAAVSLLPVLTSPSAPQSESPPSAFPEKVAGYTPSPAEREAMSRFLAEQEKMLAPLRTVELPNDLAPVTVFHPFHGRGSGDRDTKAK
jgi:hypothetical protein